MNEIEGFSDILNYIVTLDLFQGLFLLLYHFNEKGRILQSVLLLNVSYSPKNESLGICT